MLKIEINSCLIEIEIDEHVKNNERTDEYQDDLG